MTHPQANPTKVTDFQNIERITTSVLPVSASSLMNQSTDSNHHKGGKDSVNNGSNNIQNGKKSPNMSKKSDKRTTTCTCNEIKTLLKIKVTGNLDDLTITCNGVKTAESIADLVNGYCRIIKNTEVSFWDRSDMSSSATNSLEKKTEKLENQHKQQQQQSMNAVGPQVLAPNMATNDSPTNSNSGTAASRPVAATNLDINLPILSEDYVDIRLGEEEGKTGQFRIFCSHWRIFHLLPRNDLYQLNEILCFEF